MLIDNLIYYDNKHLVKIKDAANPVYYFFDYDERSYDINMEFQHFHRFYEIMILLADKAVHLINGKPFHIQQCDIVLLKPGVLHKTQYLPGDPSKRIIINFKLPLNEDGLIPSHKELLSLFQEPEPIFRFDRREDEQVFEVLNEIFNLSKNLTSINEMMIYHKFAEFLYKIYINKDKNKYVNSTYLDNNTKKIFAITAYIHEHFREPLSLDFISKKFYISYYYLCHQFKQITGFTLTDYIQMTRIKNAQQLLLSTDKKIAEIADYCGFTSFSQFNRIFNKFCDTSPSKFRSQADVSMNYYF